MPIHMWGRPENLDRVHALARQRRLTILEDACLALGAEWKGRRVGTFGKAGCFSLGCLKALQAGEGGVIVTDDEALWKELRMLRPWGDMTDAYGVRDQRERAWNGRPSQFQTAEDRIAADLEAGKAYVIAPAGEGVETLPIQGFAWEDHKGSRNTTREVRPMKTGRALALTKDPIGAGISGHKSNQMRGRVDRDVIAKKPDWMTLSCGVNDVWHGKNGVPLPAYRTNITEIVTKVQAAGIKVMILTATMIGEDKSATNNIMLAAYNDFLRELAKEKKGLLADLNADMQKEIEAAGGSKAGKNVLTTDGVHMNPMGNIMMARGILRAFGLDDAQMKKAEDAWRPKPDASSASAAATNEPAK
jgi:lysophospholipase L1-like esterase